MRRCSRAGPHGQGAPQVSQSQDGVRGSCSEIQKVSALPPVARALLELYGVESPDIDSLVQVAREARKRGWWQKFDDVLPEWFEVYVGLEAEADQLQAFEPQLVPGLLQTAQYARAVIRVEHPDAPDAEIDRRVELRMRRQEAGEGPRLWVVLDEAVLRRPVGGAETMAAQLRRLVTIAGKPGNTIQVLPFGVGEHPSMGSAFSILNFTNPMDQGIVYVETRAGSLYLEGQQVREYTGIFQHLVAAALGAPESLDMIEGAAHT